MAKIVHSNTSFKPKFNYKMRALRIALGISQGEMAELVDVSTSLISMYERGTIDGGSLENNINASLSAIRDRMIEKYGYWYDSYVELKTSTNLIDVWIEFEGYVPIEIIKKAKESSAAFMNI